MNPITTDNFIEAFIIHDCKHAVGLGHDRKAGYELRWKCMQLALGFINSDQFDVYCGFIGLDAFYLRERIRERIGDDITDMRKYLLYQMELEQIDAVEDEPEEIETVFQYGLLLDMECV